MMGFSTASIVLLLCLATALGDKVSNGASSSRARCPTHFVGELNTCCCCKGKCLYAGCVPCPCPPPPPGFSQPKCAYQQLIDRFEDAYQRFGKKQSHSDIGVDPDKTALNNETGVYEWNVSPGWRSGFFPGILWQLYNFTGDDVFASLASKFTAGREVVKSETSTHDIGFMIFNSFGNGLLLKGGNKTYEDVIVTAAHSLAVRYNKKVGMTRSWGSINDSSQFEVIIDNLMNLELLFWAARASGNKTLYDIGVSHAKRQGEVWIRRDGSTAHLCIFDPNTGDLLKPCTGTPQGLSANSTWARGQAWGIYGWTMAYRYTQEKIFLTYAEKATSFFLKNAPDDLVPIWDYDAKPPQDFKDSSGASITASGLLELADHTGNMTYYDAAMKIIRSLSTINGYTASPNGSEAVLASNAHDCGSDNCTVIESDYYLLEAIRRLEATSQ